MCVENLEINSSRPENREDDAMRRILALGLVLSLLPPAVVQAQGVLIDVRPDHAIRLPRPITIIIEHPEPRPESSYKIKELAVRATLEKQVARVRVSQSFVNTGSRQMEVCFVFPLPYDGAVESLTLMIDGKEYPAKLLKADEARDLYEQIVRKNKDPALLEWIGTGLFKTSVFPVPPGEERKVTLRYSQLCRAYQGVTDFLFPLSTAHYTSHPVEKVSIKVAIHSDEDLKNVYSPTHSVEIERPDDKTANVTFTSKNETPSRDFRLLYDVGKGKLGASVLSYRPEKDEAGYFLLLASPEIKPADEERPKKTVLFVVDRSGSMSGEKMKQAKGAAKFVLNNLKRGDLFNVIAYDSEIESWKPELQRYNDENRKSALGFVSGLFAGGSTNINGALETALGQLKDESRPNYVIFLTDGLPTVGETNEQKIVRNAKQANDARARVFAFGVGYDVNSRLLDKLVRANFGQSEYVRPDEDIEAHVSRFYKRIDSPALTAAKIKFDVKGFDREDGEPVNRVYPKQPFDLFAGEQLVLVGRYKKSGDAEIKITGKVGDEKRTFDFDARLAKKSKDDSFAFIEKLWAIRRVGEIIDEIDLHGKNDELVNELVELATKHGILTPYTSFQADENNRVTDLAANVDRANLRLENLQQQAGQSGFYQRATKGSLQRAQQAAPAADAARGLYAAEKAISAAPAAGRGAGAFGGVGAPAPGGSPIAAAKNEKQAEALVAQAVRQVGPKTFYHRDGQWIDSALSEEEQQKPIRVERFSRKYFDMIEKYGRELAPYLAFDDPVLVEVEGQAYLF
jgi:Ca-activated chloride channel family protein